jgi:acetyl esterase/lipase
MPLRRLASQYQEHEERLTPNRGLVTGVTGGSVGGRDFATREHPVMRTDGTPVTTERRETVVTKAGTCAAIRRTGIGLRAMVLLAVVLWATLSIAAAGETSAPVVATSTDDWAALLAGRYRMQTDVTYGVASNTELKLDVLQPRAAPGTGTGPNPAVIWYHGGGWVRGDKSENLLRILPFVRMGYTVFNVNYRLARQANAPAAVEDVRYALRWIDSRADKYKIDRRKLILSGTSAGGHLALAAAYLPVSAGFDRAAGSDESVSVADWWTSAPQSAPAVAAVIDFWGIADVKDLLAGPNARNWAIEWMGNANRQDLAAQLSPINLVRAGLPPTLILHGDPDPYVPFEQSVRLKEALDRAGVPCQLLRVPGGGHGDFSEKDTLASWKLVREFLARHDLLPASATTGEMTP